MTHTGGTTHAEGIEVKLENTPRGVQIDTWIPACLLLDPPRQPNGKPHPSPEKVWPVVYQLLASTANAHGDAHITVTRSAIAHWAGYSRYDKAAWIIQWLQRIGFLTVYRHYSHDKGGGRSRDSFTVRLDPPESYRGPTHTGELAAAYADPEAWGPIWAEARKTPGQRQYPPQRVKPEGVLPPAEGKARKTPGQRQYPPQRVKPEGVLPPAEGKARKTPGQRQYPPQRVFSRARGSDRSLLSSVEERRGEIEPVPGGAAEPPATGGEASVSSEAVELARRLPWRAWSERTGKRLPSRLELRRVAAAITNAMAEHGVSLDEAAEVGCRALAKAGKNPATFLVNAFTTKLDEHLPADLAEEQLTLPVGESESSAAETSPEPVLPACELCGAAEGDPAEARVKRRRGGSIVRDVAGVPELCECTQHRTCPAA